MLQVYLAVGVNAVVKKLPCKGNDHKLVVPVGVSMTSVTAFWTILSLSAATPSGRVPPSGLGISARRTGAARYTRVCTCR